MQAGRSDVLEFSSQPLRDLGAIIYVVAIGSEADQKQLESIVDAPKDIAAVASISELPSKVKSLSRQITNDLGEVLYKFVVYEFGNSSVCHPFAYSPTYFLFVFQP